MRARARTRRASWNCGRSRRPPTRRSPKPGCCPSTSPSSTRRPSSSRAASRRRCRCWTTKGDETGRVWTAGDVLVLVRKRGAAFEAVIRALKDAGVPVAGADRLNIGEHIAVLDLVAAGRAGAAAGRRPDARDRAEIAARRPHRRRPDPHRRRPRRGRIAARGAARAMPTTAMRRRRRGCEALSAWRELARPQGPSASSPPCSVRAAGARSSSRGSAARRAMPSTPSCASRINAEHDARRPSLTTFLDRFESAAHTIKRDLDSEQRRGAGDDRARRQRPRGADRRADRRLRRCSAAIRRSCRLQTADGGRIPVWSPGQDPRFGRDRRSARETPARQGPSRSTTACSTSP